jgi:hypothetical protein
MRRNQHSKFDAGIEASTMHGKAIGIRGLARAALSLHDLRRG